jgi:GNAT superfamily N-acetyltransferase
MQTDFILREVKPEDLATIHQLQKAWAAEGISYGYEAAPLDGLARQVGPYFLLAELEGAVVGFISATVRVSEGLAVVPVGLSYLEVDDLYVTPPCRGRGLGSKLLEAVLNDARAAGLKRCTVYSSTKDARRILDFYQGHGFKSWFVQMFTEL